MQAGYTFASQPRAVQRKFRDPGESDAAGKNIMHDRRVIRGNTRALQRKEMLLLEEEARLARERKMRRSRRSRTPQSDRAGEYRRRTPSPVQGRAHMEVQTVNYLEEITAKPDEAEMETQTDPLLDRPPSPIFMPKPSGEHMATQVEPGELFDYEAEVEPILQVLVGKTLDHALMEVLEEEELKAIRAHQLSFEQRRNAELAEMQRLEAAEIRRNEEKERRKQQEEERLAAEKEAARKLAARSVAKNYLTDLQDKVFNRLQEAGHFYDPLQREVEQQFVPWLVEKVVSELSSVVSSRQLVDAIVNEALARGSAQVTEGLQQMDELEAQREQARQEAIKAEQERLRLEKEAQEEAARRKQQAEEEDDISEDSDSD